MSPSSSPSPAPNSGYTQYAWVRVLFFLLSFFLMSIAMQAGSMYLLSLLAGVPFSEFAVNFQQRIAAAEVPIASMLLIQSFGFFGMLGLVIIFRRYLDRKSVFSLGLDVGGRTKDALIGFSLGILLISIGFTTLWLLGMVSVTSTQFAAGSLLLSFIFYLVVSLNEEIMLRGYVLNNLMKDYNPYNALGVTSLLFTIMHGFNPNITLVGFVNIFLAGLLFGLYYIHQQNLWFPIMIHLSWNFFLGPIFGFEVSGIKSPSLFVQNVKGPEILTGGAFGFEGSIILTVLLITSCYWIHTHYR